MNRNRRAIKRVFVSLLTIIIIALIIAFIVNRAWIYDFFRGLNYQPTTEMASIRSALNLTDYGSFIFNSSWPELNERDSFNLHCREQESEDAVLGCYDRSTIYIYNITEPELAGIRELTTAHELLHAVYTRLNDQEKLALQPILLQVFNSNQSILSEEIASYPESEQLEEIYVRAGTEIANLPATLESHYAKIFKNQDSIVDFYNSYISVFNSLENELETLSNEITALNEEIERKTSDYNNRADVLDSNITSFNACANTINCFSTDAEFYARRNELMLEYESLDDLYNELSALIDAYNIKVNTYNNTVIHSNTLNTIINSTSRPEDITSK